MSIPICMMMDDSSPLVNAFWWAAAERQGDAPAQDSGEPIPRDLPGDFVRRFAEVIASRNIRGKFTVLPCPGGLGKISEGWPGCDMQAMEQWIDVVRRDVMPLMDITPEIHTHAKALDLDSFTLLDENERDWASHQTEATLTPYIAESLRFLNEVGLTASGVTSPWDFGREVEEDYQRAILAAMKEVNGIGQTWYFLHVSTEGTDFLSSVVHHDGEDTLVSIASQCGDLCWATMETQEDSAEYIRSVADLHLTEDGRRGRLAELFLAGVPVVFHTHWQSLFSNGRLTGLRALDEVGRRVEAAWGQDARWVKCSELAAEMVAGEWGSAS